MATVEVALTLDEKLVEEAREMAGARGLSAYANDALRNQLRRDRLHRSRKRSGSSGISDKEIPLTP